LSRRSDSLDSAANFWLCQRFAARFAAVKPGRLRLF